MKQLENKVKVTSKVGDWVLFYFLKGFGPTFAKSKALVSINRM